MRQLVLVLSNSIVQPWLVVKTQYKPTAKSNTILVHPVFFISNKNVGEGFKLLSFGHF